MSDSVTNVEIEDVLSSIRRLVSVDAARTPRATGTPAANPGSSMATEPEVPARPAREGKLMLTSDLRVKSGYADRIAARGDTDALKRRIAELEAAVNAQAAEFEPDGSEDTSQHRPSSIPPRSPRKSVDADVPVNDDGVVDVGVFVLHDDMGVPDATDSTATSEADPAPNETPGIAASPSDETLMSHLKAAQGEGALAADRDAADSDASDAAPQDAGEDSDTGFAEVLDAEHHRVHPFSVGGMNDTLSDDGGGGLTLGEEDALIDEETLREMVAEIVREELQGALGERITRNVRKLVRREIMRAISIRDFE